MFCFPQHAQMGLTASYSERSWEFTAGRKHVKAPVQPAHPCQEPGVHVLSLKARWVSLLLPLVGLEGLLSLHNCFQLHGWCLEMCNRLHHCQNPNIRSSTCVAIEKFLIDGSACKSVSVGMCVGGSVLLLLIISPVPLHPAARSAWWDLVNLSLRKSTEEGTLTVWTVPNW